MRLILVLGTALALAAPSSVHAQDRGERLFRRRCGGCHALDANRVGPALGGVFGRPVATAPDFRYSAALRAQGFIWEAASLDRWLAGPGQVVSGTAMTARVADPGERAEIIAFLRARSPAR